MLIFYQQSLPKLNLHCTSAQLFELGQDIQSVSSVTQSCLTLWYPMDGSTPGFPIHHQPTRLPYPSPTPGAYSNSCPSCWWCHPTISSFVVPFSHLQSFPASGSFPMSWFFASGGQRIGFQLQHQSFQWTFRTDFL